MEPYRGRVPDRIPAIGDHVTLMWDINGWPHEQTGWVLNVNDGVIRIGAMQADDGRPDTIRHPIPDDWWRLTKPLSDVSVIFH